MDLAATCILVSSLPLLSRQGFLLVGKEGLDCCSQRGFTGLYTGSGTLVKEG
jgi:hypothetical protein